MVTSLLLTLLAAPALSAEPYVPPVDALVDETFKSPSEDGRIGVVWWLPVEFWEAALHDNPDVTASQAAKFVEVLRPYTLLVVVDGTMGPMGAATFRPESEVRATLKLRDAKGKAHVPLADSAVSADAMMLVKVMQPMLAGMLGQMGASMGFFFFDVAVDPRSDQGFAAVIGERVVSFQLPVESLFRPVHCPTCSRDFKGTYKFCPYDGTHL
ncbi:MAG: hypothetical protein H6738_21935 [Alphaproteobacteria bacterium]|nr:hypothetical protein [Alphaproteobacteria bacterium]MCB9699459.1 hypothetical protein [Alphaproteobacteria bacterium]